LNESRALLILLAARNFELGKLLDQDALWHPPQKYQARNPDTCAKADGIEKKTTQRECKLAKFRTGIGHSTRVC